VRWCRGLVAVASSIGGCCVWSLIWPHGHSRNSGYEVNLTSASLIALASEYFAFTQIFHSLTATYHAN